MCGLTGFISFKERLDPSTHLPLLEEMSGMMQRRGPDDAGQWLDPQGRVAFAFRRLAVIDLSRAAHQPMHAMSGRSVLMLNGEIYNYQDLRRELEALGLPFRSYSDTEVLLSALEQWGLDETLQRINGMFAFAWYQREEGRLTLARDHAGIKPLYYAIHPQKGLTFASQFSTVLKGPWESPKSINEEALYLYLKLHHFPAPHCLYKDTYQLEPGSYLQVNADGTLHKKQWWRLPRHLEAAFLPLDSALDELKSVLSQSVRRHCIADVPLGVFLSGGIDSPLVSALASQQFNGQLNAFTISVPGWWQDESADAERYAKRLGVNHHVIAIDGEDVLSVINEVVTAQHEPFADYSIIPTLLISKYARQKMTVALSGDGGDELFFGYERPLSLLRNGNDFKWPWLVRAGLYGAGKLGIGKKRSDVIVSKSPGEYYFNVNARFGDAYLEKIFPGLVSHTGNLDLYAFNRYQGVLDLANYSRYVEFYGQLQRGLKKVDLASSHASLEVRVPLLDRQVLELSLKIDPFEMMRGGNRKWVLRKLLENYIPAIEIPIQKRGFAIPLGQWLRGPLKHWAEEIFFDQALYPEGLLNRQALSAYWQEHLSGEKDHKWGLWTLLALQSWAVIYR